MDCEYCHKKFTTKYLLTQHQNKTRYCLELQGKNDTLHECEYCKKSLSTNERLITHLNTCKLKKQKELNDKDIYYQNIIAIKDNEIKELKAKLEKFENAVISVRRMRKMKTKTFLLMSINNSIKLLTLSAIQKKKRNR